MPIPRQSEIRRRRKRQNKLRALKTRLIKAESDKDRKTIIEKMERISPFIMSTGQSQPKKEVAAAPTTET